MATNSPMSNFNRKNPYVIQTKQQYSNLMELYEQCSKKIIMNSIILLLALVITTVVTCIRRSFIMLIPIMIILCIFVLITYYFIKNTIKDDINKDIDNLVTIESNEVMNVDITYVQDVLYKVHNRIGKVSTMITLYDIATINLIISLCITLM